MPAARKQKELPYNPKYGDGYGQMYTYGWVRNPDRKTGNVRQPPSPLLIPGPRELERVTVDVKNSEGETVSQEIIYRVTGPNGYKQDFFSIANAIRNCNRVNAPHQRTLRKGK